MDLIETLLNLYQQAKTSSERWMLLETMRLSNPPESAKFEERILQEHVRTMTHAQLIHTVAVHCNLSPASAEILVRETVLKHLLDQVKLREALIFTDTSPATKTEPREETTGPAAGQTEAKMEVVILEGEKSGLPGVPPKTPGEALPSGTNLPRLVPRGVAG